VEGAVEATENLSSIAYELFFPPNCSKIIMQTTKQCLLAMCVSHSLWSRCGMQVCQHHEPSV